MIYTSYFDNIRGKKLPKNYIPIAISLTVKKWYKGARYLGLAPTTKMLEKYHYNNDDESFTKDFEEEILLNKDPYKILDDLYIQLTREQKENFTNREWWNDKNTHIVLICHEKPNLFCHRHLVAKWLDKLVKNITIIKELSIKEIK